MISGTDVGLRDLSMSEIDYNSGEISFTTNRIITKDHRISIEFEYAEQKQKKLTSLRQAFESYPFVSGLKSIFADQQNSNKWKHMMFPFDALTNENLHEIKQKVKDLGLDISIRLS